MKTGDLGFLRYLLGFCKKRKKIKTLLLLGCLHPSPAKWKNKQLHVYICYKWKRCCVKTE